MTRALKSFRMRLPTEIKIFGQCSYTCMPGKLTADQKYGKAGDKEELRFCQRACLGILVRTVLAGLVRVRGLRMVR